jgi:predicted anti-sigma-YlaC factor YlaD
MHAACDRARQWATADLDGELSRFERALLEAHVDACPSCHEFQTAIGSATDVLRATPLERLEEPIQVRRIRSRPRIRLASAAAAMAIAAVVAGSGLVSAELRNSSVTGATAPIGAAKDKIASVDMMNLSTAGALGAEAAAATRAPAKPAGASLRGGPVLRDS